MITTSETIYQTIQRSTSSGRGVSYWSEAANCGKKRQLIQLHAEIAANAETSVQEKRLGTFYHALLDFWLKGTVPEGLVIDVSATQDSEWAEAVRLFNFQRENFPRDFFGHYVASEVKLPVNDKHRELVRDYFGHDEITGAIDALFMMSEADVARVETECKVHLAGPGLYAIDWKTSGARKSDMAAESQYTGTMQAMAYPMLWDLAGGEPCKGMIFQVIVKHEELRRHDVNPKKLSSCQTFFAPARPEHALIVKNGINLAKQSRDDGRANPYACYGQYGTCPFLNSGLCGRI